MIWRGSIANTLEENFHLKWARIMSYMRLRLNKSLIPSTLFPPSALKYITAKVTDGRRKIIYRANVRTEYFDSDVIVSPRPVKNSCNGSAGNAERPLGRDVMVAAEPTAAGTAVIYRWAQWASSAPAGASCKESSALWHCRTSWSAASHYCRTTPATVSSTTWGTHRKHCVKTRVNRLHVQFPQLPGDILAFWTGTDRLQNRSDKLFFLDF